MEVLVKRKCNTCTKFLTCDRKECKKVTFYSANIIDKLEVEKLNEDH